MAEPPRLLVVGAGIVGASIAWHLSRAGARVTVIDGGAPGGIATRNSWGWINASWGNPEPYFRLRTRAMEEWRRLEQAVPRLRVAWVGGLLWELPPDQLEAFAVQHAAWGYGIHRVGRLAVQQIEPHLAAPPDFALHVPAEGSVEPLAAALALLRAARDNGATVIMNTPVRRLDWSAGRVAGVETDTGRYTADTVVVACGIDTKRLLATVGLNIPVTASPALVVVTQPHVKCVNGLVIAPGIQVRQTADGRLIATSDITDTDPDADGAADAAALVDAMRRLIVSGASISPDYHVVAHRPIPPDGLPVVGRVDAIPDLYVAVMHSGITLAPAIGRFIAEEVLTGRRDNLLLPYGPGRLLPSGEVSPAV